MDHVKMDVGFKRIVLAGVWGNGLGRDYKVTLM
jgi:hypothetical protein